MPPKSEGYYKRQKKKQQKKSAKFNAMVQEQHQSAGDPGKRKEQEMASVRAKLKAKKMSLVDIPSDGDCLFRAVIDQTKYLAAVYEDMFVYVTSPDEMRKLCADHISANRAEFEPYFAAGDINELSDGSGDEVEEGDATSGGAEGEARQGTPATDAVSSPLLRYCSRLAPGKAGEGRSKIWGGPLEIKAMADALQLPICVITADSPDQIFTPSKVGASGSTDSGEQEPSKLEEEGGKEGSSGSGKEKEGVDQPMAVLVHLKHYYASGFHYSSTRIDGVSAKKKKK